MEECTEDFTGQILKILDQNIHMNTWPQQSEKWRILFLHLREKKEVKLVKPPTFFSLRTCFGAPIQALSVFPKEREVLIPPHEVFVVTSFFKDGNNSLVTLSSSDQMCSHFNCAYLGGEPCMRKAELPGGPQLISVPRAFKRPT